MIADYKFTPLRMNTPHDNLCTAISIIQTQIMATDSDLIPNVMFGNYHFTTDQMQAAVALLVAMIGEVENMRWNPETP